MRTQNLIGAQLDWAVAKCEGYECEFGDEVSGPWLVPQEGYLNDEKPLASFRPSTNWARGGSIIQREQITITHCNSAWEALVNGHIAHGPTPLVAAMRVYVMAKLGDEINIPEELL